MLARRTNIVVTSDNGEPTRLMVGGEAAPAQQMAIAWQVVLVHLKHDAWKVVTGDVPDTPDSLLNTLEWALHRVECERIQVEVTYVECKDSDADENATYAVALERVAVARVNNVRTRAFLEEEGEE